MTMLLALLSYLPRRWWLPLRAAFPSFRAVVVLYLYIISDDRDGDFFLPSPSFPTITFTIIVRGLQSLKSFNDVCYYSIHTSHLHYWYLLFLSLSMRQVINTISFLIGWQKRPWAYSLPTYAQEIYFYCFIYAIFQHLLILFSRE